MSGACSAHLPPGGGALEEVFSLWGGGPGALLEGKGLDKD